MRRQIKDRVEIKGGMPEFVGQIGTIIDNTDRDGSTVMYRVSLDKPVEIAGLGPVSDDLWAGSLLRKLRPAEVQKFNRQCPYCKAHVKEVPESPAHPNGIAPVLGGGCEFCYSTLPASETIHRNYIDCRCGGTIRQSSGECDGCDDPDPVL